MNAAQAAALRSGEKYKKKRRRRDGSDEDSAICAGTPGPFLLGAGVGDAWAHLYSVLWSLTTAPTASKVKSVAAHLCSAHHCSKSRP